MAQAPQIINISFFLKALKAKIWKIKILKIFTLSGFTLCGLTLSGLTLSGLTLSGFVPFCPWPKKTNCLGLLINSTPFFNPLFSGTDSCSGKGLAYKLKAPGSIPVCDERSHTKDEM